MWSNYLKQFLVLYMTGILADSTIHYFWPHIYNFMYDDKCPCLIEDNNIPYYMRILQHDFFAKSFICATAAALAILIVEYDIKYVDRLIVGLCIFICVYIFWKLMLRNTYNLITETHETV